MLERSLGELRLVLGALWSAAPLRLRRRGALGVLSHSRERGLKLLDVCAGVTNSLKYRGVVKCLVAGSAMGASPLTRRVRARATKC